MEEGPCGTNEYCEWATQTKKCSAKSEFGDKSVDAAICKPLDYNSCESNDYCQWTCASFDVEKCGDQGLMVGYEQMPCNASGCSVNTCCAAPANPGAAVTQS
jgi:hypothetical protein